MLTLEIIKDSHNRTCILGRRCEEPSTEWLAMQQRNPGASKVWYSAYPLSGGAVMVQRGAFTFVRDATQADIDEACTRGFNPAANTIKQLLNVA